MQGGGRGSPETGLTIASSSEFQVLNKNLVSSLKWPWWKIFLGGKEEGREREREREGGLGSRNQTHYRYCISGVQIVRGHEKKISMRVNNKREEAGERGKFSPSLLSFFQIQVFLFLYFFNSLHHKSNLRTTLPIFFLCTHCNFLGAIHTI